MILTRLKLDNVKTIIAYCESEKAVIFSSQENQQNQAHNKEARTMENNKPIITHIIALLEQASAEQLRVLYQVIRAVVKPTTLS